MPSASDAPRLGELERAVMERLWSAADPAGSTVREVHESLTARNLAYTTVMTVLNRLTKKGLVGRERDGRAWRYLPSASREELTAQTMRNTMDTLDGTGRRSTLLHFLDGASDAELADVKAALAEIEARTQP